MKKITFDTYDAGHLYELCYKNAKSCKGCWECERLLNRLEKFIGKKEVVLIKRMLKKSPYKK